MAVDFSTKATSIDTQIEPGSQIVKPVSREGEIDALNTIGRGVEAGAKTVATIFRNRNTINENKFLSDFSIRLNSLQDAADQGLSTSEIRTRSRALLSEALANNPDAEDETLKRYSTWLTQSGVSKIDAPSVQKAQIDQAQVTAAVSNGFLSADKVGDPAARDAAISELEAYQTAVTQLDMETKRVNAETGKLGLSEKQKSIAKAEGEEAVITSLAKVGQAALPYWRTQYEAIKTAAKDATSEQERDQIIKDGIMRLEQDFAQRTAAIAGDGMATNQAKLDQILQPQKNLIETYVKELKGEYDLESFKRSSDAAEAQAKMLVWRGLTPQQRQWIAMSNISKAAGDVLSSQMATVAVDMFSKNAIAGDTEGTNPNNRTKPADVLPAGDEDAKGVKDYLDSVETLVKRSNAGQLDEATQAEVQSQMRGILRGVDVHSNSVESAKEFQPVIDFFSNPDVGEYLSKAGGIPPEITGKVLQVFQDGYASQVVPLLRKDYGDTIRNTVSVRVNGENVPMSVDKLADPTMETGRFGFKIKPEFADNFAAKTAVRTLNNGSLVKVLNKMVIANAHIQGNTDYKASYEQIAPDIFGEAKPLEEGSLKAEDNLQLASLIDSPNPDVIQEVMDARDVRAGIDPSIIETDNKRGYEPDIDNLKPELAQKVVELQVSFGKAIPVISGYRDAKRNKKAKGASKSQHIHGNAVDLDVSELSRSERISLIKKARGMGFTGVGVYANSLHFDLGSKRAWGPSHHKESIPQWAMAALGD